MNQSSLRSMFLLCRETGLSVDPILLWDDCDGDQSVRFKIKPIPFAERQERFA